MGLRSLLFVPTLAERFIEKAPSRGADAIALDLEDAIAPARKAEARAALPDVARRLAPSGIPLMVRVNHRPDKGIDDLLKADIAVAVRGDIAAIKLPKIETAEQVQACAALVERAEQGASLAPGRVWLMPMLETPLGVLNASAIAACHPRVRALAFGVEDFAQAMNIPANAIAMAMPAQMVAIAAAAHRLPALGLPGSVAEFTDLEAFRRTAELARTLGFSGSGCIHPAQVTVLNAVFGVSDDELRSAREVVRLYEDALAHGDGAIAHRGRMIDIPIYERARALLREARPDVRPPSGKEAT